MTPEEITAMAKEAGFPFNKYGLLQGDDDGEIDADAAFAIFAALVAAKEREACGFQSTPAIADGRTDGHASDVRTHRVSIHARHR